MFNQSILKICLFAFLLIFLSSTSPCCYEKKANMLLGFIDDGSWHEKGALYLEVPFAPVMNQKKFNEVIVNNYSRELIHKGYFEIAYVEVRDFVSIQKQQRFELYFKDGYLGDYCIEKFVILVNACGGGIYPYVKLCGRIIVKKQELIIARLINDGMLKKKCKVINTVRLTKNEKLKIKEILSDRFLFAMDERNNIITKYFNELRRGGWKKFAFKLEYTTFKGEFLDKHENEILVNAQWHCDNEEFKSDTGYYLTTTFLVFKNKILDVIPLKLSSNSRLDIPVVRWGIDTDTNGNVEWVILHRLWEGSVDVVMEWDDREWREVYVSNYFGCLKKGFGGQVEDKVLLFAFSIKTYEIYSNRKKGTVSNLAHRVHSLD